MGLADDLNNFEKEAPHNKCRTCWTLKDASVEDRQAVDNFLGSDQNISHLARMLKTNGYDVGYESLRRHHQNGHTLA